MPAHPDPARPALLVVDDDPGLREALATALDPPYAVHTAASGPEALARLAAHSVVAIILDVVLGAEDGLALVPQLRRRSPAPILVLTGYSTEARAIQALRAHADDYLTKPVDLPALRAALERAAPVGDRAEALVARGRQLLDRRLAVPLPLADVAARLGVSDVQLRRSFRAVLGVSPGRYRTTRRLQEGLRLLTTTALGVDQIAREVGYCSGTAFGRVFRRAYGRSPSASRIPPG